jgi:ribosomal protein S18 acetylase RimI-like enzyme
MIAVRPGMPGDIDDAIAVWAEANVGSEPPGHAARLRAWAADPGALLIVAIEGTTIAGMVLLLAGRADDGAGPLIADLGHLTGLAVLPDRQGQGVGGRLLVAAETAAASASRRRMTAWVRTTNQASLRLFARNGFGPVGRELQDSSGMRMSLLQKWICAIS